MIAETYLLLHKLDNLFRCLLFNANILTVYIELVLLSLWVTVVLLFAYLLAS